MIRVLHIVTDMRRGGLETMIMNYYRHIDRELVQFDFLVHREKTGDYEKEIDNLGGKIYHMPVLNPFSIIYKKKLGDFFIGHPEYDIIHVHQDCLSSVILKVAKEHGVKVRIAHSHASSQDKNFKYPIKLFFRRYIPEYATELMACGKEAGEWMFCGAQYHILANAIEIKKYSYNKNKRRTVREEFGIEEDELIIGHIGRFSPPKNHSFLIDIFSVIQKKKKCRLLLVGDGNLKKEIREKVQKLGLLEKVIFAGVRSDVPDLLQAMDIFVFPSLYEGLGIVAVEAQAAGLPCVLSDKIPDAAVITKLVKKISLESTAEMWAEAVVTLIGSKREDTYESIKSAGFDIEQNAIKLQEFYLQALRGENNLCRF